IFEVDGSSSHVGLTYLKNSASIISSVLQKQPLRHHPRYFIAAILTNPHSAVANEITTTPSSSAVEDPLLSVSPPRLWVLPLQLTPKLSERLGIKICLKREDLQDDNLDDDDSYAIVLMGRSVSINDRTYIRSQPSSSTSSPKLLLLSPCPCQRSSPSMVETDIALLNDVRHLQRAMVAGTLSSSPPTKALTSAKFESMP
ncbi:hypothetical protein HN873_056776, partial [Arachis hypogaea]